MDEKEYNVVTLENGIEYTEIYRINCDGNTYVFLSNLDNPEDFCIRKLVVNNQKEQIIGLDNRNEFDRVLALFTESYLS